MTESCLMDTLKFVEGHEFKSGNGCWLTDTDGRSFLDFYADVGTASLGYSHDRHYLAMKHIMDEAIPVHSPIVFSHVTRNEAARHITLLTGMDKVFFCNSGAEAVEAAIKCARLTQFKRGRPERIDVYSVRGGFHGRTLATLACGDGPPYHHTGFGPLPSGFKHFDGGGDFASQIRKDAAAVCLAPVFGNNDVQVYKDKWLYDLAEYCRENEIVLIFDEVQSGSGRTGTAPTYAQRLNLKPDIITLGKGVAGGAACGAMLARHGAASAFTPGSHFSTFGGQPLISAFVSTMCKYLSEPGQLMEIECKGKLMQYLLREIPGFTNVRGVGMLVAFDVDCDKLDFAKAALDKGLLLGLFRSGPGPVKITPPLIISEQEIRFGIGRLRLAYESLVAK